MKIVKIIRKSFKVGVISLASLILLVVLAVLIVLQWPSTVINPKSLQWGARLARKADVDLSWKSATVRAQSLSFFTKSFGFDFKEFCTRIKSSPVNGCFGDLSFAFIVDLHTLPPKFVEVGPVAILDGDVTYKPAEGQAKKKQPPVEKPKQAAQDSNDFLPPWLKDAKLREIRVGLREWKAQVSPDQTLTGSLDLRNVHADEGMRWKVSVIEKQSSQNGKGHHAQADLDLGNLSGVWTGPWSLGLFAKARFDDGRTAHLEAQFQQKATGPKQDKKDFSQSFAYSVNASWVDGVKLIVAKLGGDFSPNSVQGALQASARNLVPYVQRIALNDCTFNLSRTHVELSSGDFKLDCPITARVQFPPVNSVPNLKLPTETSARLKVSLKTAFPPSADEKVDGNISLQLDPILNPIFEGEGNIASKVAGVPSEFPKAWQLDTDLGLMMKVPHFEKVVALLAKTATPIPAPLNVLTGTVQLGATGRADLNGGTIPVYFRTRLASVDEKLNLDANGEVNLLRTSQGMKTALKTNLVLSEVKLALPRLDLGAPPRFFPDSRIHSTLAKSGAGSQKPSDFSYQISVTTPADRPIQLLSNLAKAPIPVQVNVAMGTENPLSGTIQVADFPLQLFKRDAAVEHFKMGLQPDPDKSDLDGAIRVEYTDYTVRILVFGTAKKPRYRLLSNPPLPEQDVIAVLLFGHPLQ